MITLAFYKANCKYADCMDKIIAWWTKGKYSHVEIIIDKYQYSSFTKNGVRKKPHYFNPDVWDYIDIEVPDVKAILDFFNKTEGKKYDWWGVFGFVIPIRQKKRRYFCSEWVTEALQKAGYEKVKGLKPHKISPNKLYKIITSE